MPLLEVSDLHVEFDTPRGPLRAVNGLSLSVNEGEIVGIVGESGCGKTTLALSIMGLITPPVGKVAGGSIVFEGRDLTRLSQKQMREVQGRSIGLVFQDAMAALNPVVPIGRQIEEVVHLHEKISSRAAKERVIEQLRRVGIPCPEERVRAYPHQLSGGLRQRALIAMALICSPTMLIADEPTTALDVTIQAQIIDLIRDLRRSGHTTTLWITHDLGVVAGLCDRVAVMYAGEVVEFGSVAEVYSSPAHPYTRGLLLSVPRIDTDSGVLTAIDGSPPDLSAPARGCSFAPRCGLAREMCCENPPTLEPAGSSDHATACWSSGHVAVGRSIAEEAGRSSQVGPTVLRVDDLRVTFPGPRTGLRGRKQTVVAVDGVSLDLHRGETLGLVGESGCGKSTTARAIMQLCRPAGGEVVLGERNLTQARGREVRSARQRIQMVFQNPYASLNPRLTVGRTIGEPLRLHGGLKGDDCAAEVGRLLRMVGMDESASAKYPHEFSGGQRQRIGLARALAAKPEVIICDEPVSALDVSVQAQIVNLLRSVQDETGIAYVFIAHDLSVVRHMCDRVAVMYLGKIVEHATKADLYRRPLHPYTQALLSAAPVPDPAIEAGRVRTVLAGEPPSAISRPLGCAFHPRCPVCVDQCSSIEPELGDIGGEHRVACHLAWGGAENSVGVVA